MMRVVVAFPIRHFQSPKPHCRRAGHLRWSEQRSGLFSPQISQFREWLRLVAGDMGKVRGQFNDRLSKSPLPHLGCCLFNSRFKTELDLWSYQG